MRLENGHDMPAISVENVSKYYRGFSLFNRNSDKRPVVWALQDVSFQIQPGETLGLLGPNGAGKTTLLKILTNLLYPTSGRVQFHGHDLRTSAKEVRKMCGLVTCDERSFYWRLTGRKNLEFFATLYGLDSPTMNRRIDTLLDKLGLTHAADKPYAGYSSGMKQKMAIARGLLADPKIVFLDEPTRSLDPLSCQTIRGWIAQTKAEHPERTHLLATNQLDEAEQLCDRVIIINRGRLIAGGSIDEVRQRFDEREYEIRRVTFSGWQLEGQLEPDDQIGLLELTTERVQGDQTTIRIRTRKNSHAFSWVLERILHGGGVIIDCQTETVSFDDVFCSLVLGNQEEESAPAAEAVNA